MLDIQKVEKTILSFFELDEAGQSFIQGYMQGRLQEAEQRSRKSTDESKQAS